MTGFLVAGTASSVGKTTVTLALIAGLRRRGLKVQPFKAGPDFLDTMHHTQLSDRASRNLDTWMLSEHANRQVFAKACEGADAAVVEGMMGLFDGKSATEEIGSSAEIAKLLGLPVVLVLDASKSARSIAAIVLGFESFDPVLHIAGVVLNRVAGERHAKLLAEAIAGRCNSPVLGSLPRDATVGIAERHLGLHATLPEDSETLIEKRRSAFASLAEEHLDLGAFLRLKPAAASTGLVQPAPTRRRDPVRIGVARDAAFCFVYEDNLDLLRNAGAEIVPCSPLSDADLPPRLDALYLPGGYPELYAATLAGNESFRRQVREFARGGRPVYAECGGMLYLGERLTDESGSSFGMAGVLPMRFVMTERLVDFGYVSVKTVRETLLGPAGQSLRGHSFHYSRMESEPTLDCAYHVEYSLSGRQQSEGYSIDNVLATYVHLHFRTAPAIAEHFVAAALAARSAQDVLA